MGQLMSESGVPRQNIYLTTKVWDQRVRPGQGDPEPGGEPGKLRTDYLTWRSFTGLPQDEVPMAVYLEQLAEAKARGLTREIGVSNFTVAQL